MELSPYWTSFLPGVPQRHHAAVAKALLDQAEVEPDAVAEEPLPTNDDHRAGERVELVDETRPDRRGGELRAGDGQVAGGAVLEASDDLRVERAFDARAGDSRCLEVAREHDFVGRLPLPHPRDQHRGLSGVVGTVSQYAIVSYIRRSGRERPDGREVHQPLGIRLRLPRQGGHLRQPRREPDHRQGALRHGVKGHE
jgi:hypothetical protein